MKEKRELIAVITSLRPDEETIEALSPDVSKAALDDHLASVSAAPKGQVFVDYDDEGK